MVFPLHYIKYIELGLLSLFSFATLAQLYFYLRYYSLLAFHHKKSRTKSHPVSVIICARNEADNLRKNLAKILEQKHSDFEVIVVNDCSTDNTDEVLGEFLKKYKHLRTTSICPDSNFIHGKKLAITVGVKAAKNEWLVFTDADCYPASDQWLNKIQQNYYENTEIVLGYGGYEALPGLLNKYIRYDTMTIANQYLSYALAGKPYMGVGRNLSYRKSLFFRNKGFATHYSLLSGDDDLFVNETANRKNTAVEFSHPSHTRSQPKRRWKDWFFQKKRHVTTSGRYKAKHKWLLGFEPFTRCMFYLSSAALILLNLYMPYILFIIGLRYLIILFLLQVICKRLKEPGLILWIVIFDIFSMFINFSIYLSSGYRTKKKRWK